MSLSGQSKRFFLVTASAVILAFTGCSGEKKAEVPAQPEQGQHLIVAGCRSQLAQVVTLATTGIKAADRRTGGSVGQRNPADCRGDRLVMAGVEETPAGRDHFLAVTGVARTLLLDGQQVGVALGGDVETVAGGATPA